jgi:hypothetical protein
MELGGPGVQSVADSQLYNTQNSIDTILKFKISSIIRALEELFIILYNAIVPSICHLPGIINSENVLKVFMIKQRRDIRLYTL